MKALIFNSGRGSRLQELSAHNHKSMLRLANGETIFSRQLRLLSECGITDFIVTLGYKKEQIIAAAKDFPQLSVTFVDNPLHAATNYIYSMYLAGPYLDDDLLILHGDLVFNRSLVRRILASEKPSLCLITQSMPAAGSKNTVDGRRALLGKDFKGRLKDGCLAEVSVDIYDDDCQCFWPFYKLTQRDVAAWMEAVRAFINKGQNQVYAEDALNGILGAMKIQPLFVANDYVAEIDDPADYQRVSAEIRLFDYREQVIHKADGLEAVLLGNNHKKKIMLVGGGQKAKEIREFLETHKFEYVQFDGSGPNPDYADIKKGVDLFRQENCNFLISIGGGSRMDAAKAIKLLVPLDNETDFLEVQYKYSSIGHLAIPTTAGSGAEATKAAVMYYKGEKMSLSHDGALPDYVILEPKYLSQLPDYVKKSALLDALCQAVESIWSKKASAESMGHACEAIKLIRDNVGAYMGGSEDAAKHMLWAAHLSGRAINISNTTAPHAMSYKMISLFGISHGHAVAMMLPLVWQNLADSARHFAAAQQNLQQSLARIRAAFGEKSDAGAISRFTDIYDSMALPDPPLVTEDEIHILTESVNKERLGNHPLDLDNAEIESLYRKRCCLI